jgi:hypothetical protein
MEEQLSFLHIAVLVCMCVLFVSFFATLYATFLVITRTEALANQAEERLLSWGERAGRANSCFGRFLIADEFRPLRRLYFGAWIATIGSFGLSLLLLFIAERS